MKRLAPIVFLLFLTLPAWAARPLVTDDFYTVPSGGYELELGYDATQNQGPKDNFAVLSFKHGFLPNFDIGVEVPYTLSNPSGLNDIYLHFKCRLWERDKDNGLTARIDYKFNNGDINQGLGSGDDDFWLMLIYSKMFGRLKAHLNFGYVNVGINAGQTFDDYLAYAGAIEYSIWEDRGEIVAEYVMNNVAQPNPAFVQFGVRYVIRRGLKLDAGYGFGLNNNSIKNSLTAGFHCEF